MVKHSIRMREEGGSSAGGLDAERPLAPRRCTRYCHEVWARAVLGSGRVTHGGDVLADEDDLRFYIS